MKSDKKVAKDNKTSLKIKIENLRELSVEESKGVLGALPRPSRTCLSGEGQEQEN